MFNIIHEKIYKFHTFTKESYKFSKHYSRLRTKLYKFPYRYSRNIQVFNKIHEKVCRFPYNYIQMMNKHTKIYKKLQYFITWHKISKNQLKIYTN